MVDMINDVFYTQLNSGSVGWNEIEGEPLIKRKGPNKNTLEQINNNNHNNIYVGLNNDFMRSNHIVLL